MALDKVACYHHTCLLIHDLLHMLVSVGVGCSIGGQFINALAYADDLVLIAPSWRAMQNLLHIFGDQASILHMSCNVQKNVCMVFQLPTQTT